MSPAAQLRQLCAPFTAPRLGAAIWQLINTAPPFLLLWGLVAYGLTHRWNLALIGMLALPAAGLYVRIFIIQHDCGHGSYFASKRANDVTGAILGVITLFPYGYWKKTHAIHHGTSGNLDKREIGDITTLTVAEYRRLKPLQKLAYRLYRSAPVLLLVGPFYQFVIKHRIPFDLPLSWKREWSSVLRNNIALLLTYGTLCWVLGWKTVLLTHLPIVLLAGAIGVWLFYVQHTFEGAYWARSDKWSAADAALQGSSYFDLPRVLHWFTGNIGYHHLHHLSARIPNYRLSEAFRSHPALQAAPRITLWSSLKSLRLKLWDEEQGKMVGFTSR